LKIYLQLEREFRYSNLCHFRNNLMTKLQLRPRNRVTLPDSITEELGIAPGDDLLVEVRDGQLILIPAESVPRDEAYLFTPYWQQAIAEAEEDIAEGRVESAPSAREMFGRIHGKSEKINQVRQ
jgi:AbrB family looped-hinge helix DNA binding protein